MPNRIIKESICRSDTIDSLSWFEEVLFYRLIVVCDDYGRFDGRTAIIKGSCFPLKDVTVKQIKNSLDKLVSVGLVRVYEAQGRPYLQMSTWEKHQQIRAKKSKFPSPDEPCNQMIPDDIKCPRNRESKYENRESYSRIDNAPAREKPDRIERFDEFWSAYPLDKSRYLSKQAYISVVSDGIYTENDLVESAKNYAEYCRITGTDKIYHANNFLEKAHFEDYLPGKYKKPTPKKTQNEFNNIGRQDYDIEQIERDLLSN